MSVRPMLRIALAGAMFAVAAGAHAQYSAQSNGVPQQSQQPTMPGVLNRSGSDSRSDTPGVNGNEEAMRQRMLNDERHKKLLADTERLLFLAQALKDEVAKSGKDELNVDVVRKATEMEKLSHDIKERMRY